MLSYSDGPVFTDNVNSAEVLYNSSISTEIEKSYTHEVIESVKYNITQRLPQAMCRSELEKVKSTLDNLYHDGGLDNVINNAKEIKAEKTRLYDTEGVMFKTYLDKNLDSLYHENYIGSNVCNVLREEGCLNFMYTYGVYETSKGLALAMEKCFGSVPDTNIALRWHKFIALSEWQMKGLTLLIMIFTPKMLWLLKTFMVRKMV